MNQCHSIKIEQCFKQLKSTKVGLNQKEVNKRQEKYGYNELPKEKSLGKFTIFFSI